MACEISRRIIVLYQRTPAWISKLGSYLTATPFRFKSLPVFILQCKDSKTKLSPFIFPCGKLISLSLPQGVSKITQPVEVLSEIWLDLMEIVSRTFVCESLRFPVFLLSDTWKVGTAREESSDGYGLVLVDAETESCFHLDLVISTSPVSGSETVPVQRLSAKDPQS